MTGSPVHLTVYHTTTCPERSPSLSDHHPGGAGDLPPPSEEPQLIKIQAAAYGLSLTQVQRRNLTGVFLKGTTAAAVFMERATRLPPAAALGESPRDAARLPLFCSQKRDRKRGKISS